MVQIEHDVVHDKNVNLETDLALLLSIETVYILSLMYFQHKDKHIQENKNI